MGSSLYAVWGFGCGGVRWVWRGVAGRGRVRLVAPLRRELAGVPVRLQHELQLPLGRRQLLNLLGEALLLPLPDLDLFNACSGGPACHL